MIRHYTGYIDSLDILILFILIVEEFTVRFNIYNHICLWGVSVCEGTHMDRSSFMPVLTTSIWYFLLIVKSWYNDMLLIMICIYKVKTVLKSSMFTLGFKQLSEECGRVVKALDLRSRGLGFNFWSAGHV